MWSPDPCWQSAGEHNMGYGLGRDRRLPGPIRIWTSMQEWRGRSRPVGSGETFKYVDGEYLIDLPHLKWTPRMTANYSLIPAKPCLR